MQQHHNLYVFFGLIASGKSTLAEAFAERRGAAYYNSDVVRKELAGLAATADRKEAVGQGIYSSEFSRQTYDALLDRAEQALLSGKSAVVDASYQSRAEREKVRNLAKRLDVRLYFILCICPEEEMKIRMDKRAADPNAVSDGRWEIYLAQKERFEDPGELDEKNLFRINTDAPLDQLIKTLEAKLATNL